MKQISMFLFIYFIIFVAAAVAAQNQKVPAPTIPLKEGDMAPDFKLKDETGKIHRLSEFRGSKVVLYFYPKDDTPGCTKEACSFRDAYDVYQKSGVTVLGISYDTPESHKEFKEKYHLPFTLLSDETKEIAKKYGAYRGDNAIPVPRRITFLIDEKGKIIKIFPQVDVTRHAEEILNTIANLNNLKK